jgi:putative spermidine/putrescine transport system substrate-binding protein
MRRDRKRVWWVVLALVAGALAFAATGCGGDDEEGGEAAPPPAETAGAAPPPAEPPPAEPPVEPPPVNADVEAGALAELGEPEGQVDLVAWAGYVEDGSTDPNVDWVTGFEEETGCQVNVTLGNTSDEMVTLMKTGNFDGVSASGDATLRLIAAGDVAPVNLDLIPNYADVFPDLKDQPHNTVDGIHYGVPHGRGANLLMWRTDVVDAAPDSWTAVFDPNSPYAGKVTAYDSPIYIADAAVVLMATNPELGITDPYELDETQFQAAVDLLKQQRQVVGEYWSDYTKEIDAFSKKNSVIGTTWQVIVNLLQADGVPVEATLPVEGATGWSDTWMLSSQAKHPVCMYLWMNHIISPEANAAVAEWFGEAPSNANACDLTSDANHCATYHAAETEYWEKVYYWKTPVANCGDDRGEVCKDYSEWTQAWTEIKG